MSQRATVFFLSHPKSNEEMIVEDVHGYAVMIRDQFRQAYEPSTPVSVAPKLGGWPKGTPDEHRFSEDFFATLPAMLKSLAVGVVEGDDVKTTLPDDIAEATHNFVLMYDETYGYNGTKMDLEVASTEYRNQISFVARDREFARRRAVTNVPEKGKEAAWQADVNAYTIVRRPRFDHFAQADKDEYLEFKAAPYRRGHVAARKGEYQDLTHDTVSKSMRSHNMSRVYAMTTTNSLKDF